MCCDEIGGEMERTDGVNEAKSRVKNKQADEKGKKRKRDKEEKDLPKKLLVL